jgi:hypothetical protein
MAGLFGLSHLQRFGQWIWSCARMLRGPATGQTRCPIELLEPRALMSAGWDVALIDRNLPNESILERAMVPGGHVITYDGRTESPNQVLDRVIAWAGSTGSKIQSLSLLAPAAPGRFALGNEWVTRSTLPETAAAWAHLGQAMAPGGSINLYGCSLADPIGNGKALIDRIAYLTQAGVFASTNVTGRGGDWVLEAAAKDAGNGSAHFVSMFNTAALVADANLLGVPAKGDFNVSAKADGTTLAANRPYSGTTIDHEPSNEGLEQFVATNGQTLGFGKNLITVASPTDALRIDLVGARSVAPAAQPSATTAAADAGGTLPFNQVTYTDLWNGVTAVYKAKPGAVFEDSYFVAPGLAGDPVNQIRLRYNQPVTVDDLGNLVIASGDGTMTESAPVAWQDIDGKRVSIPVSFVLLGNNEVGFSVGAYDHSRQLVIDPVTSNGTVTSAQTSSATSLTWSHTVNSGTDRALFVELAVQNTGSPASSVTYGGTALTRVGRTAGNQAVEIWRLVNPPVGTANVVVTFPGSTAAAGGATTFNGVDPTTPTGTYVGATGTGISSSVVVTSAANDVVIDSENWNGYTLGYSAGSGQSVQWSQSESAQLGASTTAAGASSVTMSSSIFGIAQWATAAVSVQAATPPTVATPAAASPSPVTGTTTNLSVLGADTDGESSLTYTWATTGTPPGAVSFSANGTNAAKNTLATFTAAGTYNFLVTISDAGGLTTTSSVSVTVNPTLSSIVVSPGPGAMADNTTYPFSATALDQFGTALASQPGFTWSVGGGGAGGTINSAGLYSTPASNTGTDTIRATSGSVSGAVAVTVTGDGIFSSGVDVGPPNLPGSFSYNNGTYTVTGSEATEAPTSDQFQYANTTFNGNTTLVAEVASLNGTASPATAGIMFRDNTTNNAAFAAVFLAPGNQVTFDHRASAGASLQSSIVSGIGAPQWVKLVRSGNSFSAYYSSNGTSWSQVGSSVTYTDPASILGGLFVLSSSPSALSTATFTNVASALPLIATPAAASPNPVTGTSTNVSVLGSYAGGESNLTYTWSTTGSPPAAVTFADNGDNGAKNTTATFTKAGTYDLQVTVSNGSHSVTSSVVVTVSQTLTSITITPGTAALNENATQQFAATGYDQFNQAMSAVPFAWSNSGVGSIDSSGRYTAPGSGTTGGATVTATSGSVSGNATVTVTNAAPAVATPAAASPNPVTGASTALSVLGADDGGESNLTYTWATTGTPPAAVTFSANDSNAAKNTTATFAQAGTYNFQVTITDAGGLTTTSSVSVTVGQTPTTIQVTPANAALNENQTTQFSATAYDQFGNSMVSQPVFAWSSTGVGSVNSSGLYTASGSGSPGSATVTATTGSVSGNGSVAVTNAAPTVATAASASPAPATGITAALRVLGADDGGEPNLTYTWATTGTPPEPVTFSANGTNAAKSVTATFAAAGTYNFQVSIRDAGGLSTTSSVSVTVNQTLSAVVVTPAARTMAQGTSDPFTAIAEDQFGAPMASQPTFTWSVVGGGAGGLVTGSGEYSAPASGTGTDTVQAAAEGLIGAATVTVVAPNPLTTPVDLSGDFNRIGIVDDGAPFAGGGGFDAFGYAYSANQLGTSQTWNNNVYTIAAAGANNVVSAAGQVINLPGANDSAISFLGAAAFGPIPNLTFTVTYTDNSTQTFTQSMDDWSLPQGAGGETIVEAASYRDIYDGAKDTLPEYLYGYSFSLNGFKSVKSITLPNNSNVGILAMDVTSQPPPTVASGATATPSPVTGTTTRLSVLGGDVGGEGNLTYTWATTGTPPAAVTFSDNGDNSAKNTTATFTKAGTYGFLVTIADPDGLTTTSSVNVTVNQTLASIAVSGAPAMADNTSYPFSAVADDQFGNPMASQPSFTWSVDGGGAGGSVNASGTYTTPASAAGADSIRATSGGISGTATVTVTGDGVFTGGTDIGGPTLPGYFSYSGGTYSVTGGDNGNSSTQDQFQFADLPVSGDTVLIAKVTSVTVSPTAAAAAVLLHDGSGPSDPFAAVSVSPGVSVSFRYRTTTGASLTTVSVNGALPQWVKVVRAGNNFSGYYSSDGMSWTQIGSTISFSAPVTILAGLASTSVNPENVATSTFSNVSVSQQPIVATPAAASPSPITATSTALSVLGADDGGEANLTYTWATTGTPPAPVTFSLNGTNAAKNTIATFSAAGTYNFQVTITDASGLTTTSSVSVTVNQTYTSVAVSGTSYPFSATAKDQFGAPLATQPSFAWSILGGGAGGTINSAGDYTAPAATTGTDTLRAASGGVSGTATVTVTGDGIFTTGQDIGGPTLPGYYSYSAGTYSVTGGSLNNSNTQDQFQFANLPVTGDAALIAKVTSLTSLPTTAFAGPVFRDGSGTSDPFAAVFTYQGNICFQYRTTEGANLSLVNVSGSTPQWLKIVRVGNTFSGYYSSDGANWTQVGSTISIVASATMLAGLSSTSLNPATVATATFTNVALDQPSTVTTTAPPLNYNVWDPALAVDPGVTVADNTSSTLASATVTITGNDVDGQDVLAFTNQNGITGSWNAATGSLTLTGSASVAAYQAALESVTYQNTSSGPSSVTRTVSFQVNDGNVSSNVATKNITVDPQASIVVNTTSDIASGDTSSIYALLQSEGAGPISLRDALTAANNEPAGGLPIVIDFDIPGGGFQTIDVTSPLPAIANPVTIDGYSQPGASANTLSTGDNAVLNIELNGSGGGGGAAGIELGAGSSGSTITGLVIDGFANSGILIDGGAGGDLIVGNFLGTDASGMLSDGNGAWGVDIENAGSNVIGGSAPADRNILSGNGDGGVFLNGASVTNTTIQGNYMGVAADGQTPLGNGGGYAGVLVWQNAAGALIGGRLPGQGNVIADGPGGVTIWSGSGIQIVGNSIYNNGALGISNDLTDYPTNLSATTTGTSVTIDAALSDSPSASYTIDFYSNEPGDSAVYPTEGRTYLGSASVTTDSSGSAALSATFSAPVAPGDTITATTTDSSGQTSEFSDAATAVEFNHAPSGANNTVTVLENQAYAFTASDFGFSDPNNTPPNQLKAVEITTIPTAGTLSDAGVAVTAGQFVPVADINGGELVFTPAHDASGAGYAGFTFQVQDDGGTANGGVDLDPSPRTMAIDVTYVNQPPAVAAPAAASPNPVTGSETSLSILGADDGGEGNLTYEWAATSQPAGSNPVFSANGSNAAKDSTITFNEAGDYTFTCTITDAGGLTATSSVSVTVQQTLTAVTVSPVSVSLNENETDLFSATALDQFGAAMATQPAFTWSSNGVGSVDGSGVYTAPGPDGAGTAVVTASAGPISGSASVTVTNAAPTVAAPASASPSPVTGTTTALSVLGGDDGGEPNLTYTWATTGTPPAPVSFSDNGDNSAKETTATFSKAGNYAFQVTISDEEGLSTTSSVAVTVTPSLSSISVAPGAVILNQAQSQQFTATGYDQFGQLLASQPAVAWAVSSGAGSVTAGGLYTAPPISGAVVVTASSGSVSGNASVTVIDSGHPGIVVSPTSGLVTSQGGATTSFTVSLSSQPLADVAVPLASSDTSQGTLSVATLVFTPANWNVAQTVTVTGVYNPTTRGSVPYTIAVGPSTSADPSYRGVRAPSVSLLNDQSAAEAPVNAITDATQRTDSQSPHAVATDSQGNYVVTWAGDQQNGRPGWSVYAQRYNSSGVAMGGAILVDAGIPGSDQMFPSVAMSPSGAFAISWTIESDDTGVRVQRYNASGVAQGGIIAANTYTNGNQQWGNIAMDSAGDFVVVWQSSGEDGSGWGIYGQRYNSSGVAQGGEFRINTTTAGDQTYPSVAMDSAGDFVVTWTSNGQDGSAGGIYAQRYNASGVAQGGEFRVNTTTAGDQTTPDVAMDADGNFLIAWASQGQDGSGYGIYAQRFNSAGAAIGAEFPVNTYTSGDQTFPGTSMDADGNFVITWTSNGQDGSGQGVYAQRYYPSGATLGLPFQVNDTSSGDQQYQAAALAQTGHLVIAWSGNGTGDSTGVFEKLYAFPPGATVWPASGLTTTVSGGSASFQIALNTPPTANVTVPLSVSDSNEATISTPSVTFTPANWYVPQTVTVTGINDLVADGDGAYSVVTSPATSNDPNYSGVNPPDVSVVNLDSVNVAAINVSPASGLQTDTTGATTTFNVALNSKPIANVTLPVSSGNTAVGTVSVASLTFTPANWNVPQPVTVTGVVNHVVGPNTGYSVLVGPPSGSDPVYDGLGVSTSAITNVNRNTAGVQVSPTSGLTTSTSGAQATFQVVLTSQPTANVTVPVASSDTNQGTVSTSALTFTPDNWNVAQTIIVTGANDHIANGNQSYSVTTGPAFSADATYTGLNGSSAPLTNIN